MAYCCWWRVPHYIASINGSAELCKIHGSIHAYTDTLIIWRANAASMWVCVRPVQRIRLEKHHSHVYRFAAAQPSHVPRTRVYVRAPQWIRRTGRSAATRTGTGGSPASSWHRTPKRCRCQPARRTACTIPIYCALYDECGCVPIVHKPLIIHNQIRS